MEINIIGVIKNGYAEKKDAPRQGYFNKIKVFDLHINEKYMPAASDLKIGDKIQVLYFGNRSKRSCLRSVPPNRDVEMGVFSTRSPNRPNPIAICIADIVEVKDNIISVTGLDALEGSEILDIKGYSTAYHEKLI